MITMELYAGQGLGNQLWCYVTTRVIAKDRGYGFGVMSPHNFKGEDFMDLDFGLPVFDVTGHYDERSIIHPLNGSDIRTYDIGLVSIPDNTKIDGLMQDEQYIIHRKDEIRQWLKVKSKYECLDYASDDICVINFRGGGYVFDVDFFLPRRYWKDAIAHMRRINPKFRFVVVTDDIETAKKFFPDFEVFHWSIAKDYVVIKNAHYLILSNSSFAWFPAWLSEDLKYCIAPKYWGRYNISDGFWSLSYNITRGWTYLDRRGELHDYDSCLKELKDYIERHKDIYDAHTNGSIPRRSIISRIKNTRHIFKTIRKDTSAVYALGWIAHARGLRGTIWIKNKIYTFVFRPLKRPVTRTTKNIKRALKKALRVPGRISERLSEYRAKRAWLSTAEIVEYRKKIRIYDIFPFFNELDLLEIRLNILDPYVDYFVLVEATGTFSGNRKPLYFKENRERYKKWAHKIIHYVIEDVPVNEEDLRDRLRTRPDMSDEDRRIIEYTLSSNIIDHTKPYWVKEFYIKESIRKALVDLHDDDICYLSDLDEIWNPDLLIDYSKDDYFKPRQLPYMYYLNNRSDEDWTGWGGTVVTKYKNIRARCLNDIRSLKGKTRFTPLSNGGWHFTFQGGSEGAHRKIEESDHPFYRTEESLPNIKACVADNIDFKGRNIKLWVDKRDLPKYLLANKEKYKKLFK